MYYQYFLLIVCTFWHFGHGCTDSKICNLTCDIPQHIGQYRENNIYHENGTYLGFYWLDEAPNKSKLRSSCSWQYATMARTNGSFMSTCLEHSNGTGWKPEVNPPKCFKICDPMPISENILFKSCSNFGTAVNCNETLLAGASAIAVCKDNYTYIKNGSNETHCNDSGDWINLPICTNNCTDSETCVLTCKTPIINDSSLNNRIFDEEDWNKGFKPNAEVPRKSRLVSECREGYATTAGMNGSFTSTCFEHSNGTGWKPEIISPPKCFKICDAIPNSLFIRLKSCSHLGTAISCNETLFAGTSAIAVCRDRSFKLNTKKGGNRNNETYCNNDGKWINLPECYSDCGRVTVKTITVVVTTDKYGRRILPNPSRNKLPIFGRYAWHVVIYDISKTPPLLICGGTIVTSRIVLSAAHCFFDESSGKRLPKENYEILVSKQTRDYMKIDNHRTKKYKLEDIIFSPKEYNPNLSGNYGSDIVILVPEKPITFHEDYVWPVCVLERDSPMKYDVKDKGEVYGWGYNEHGVLSENLTYVEIPYISYNDCIRKAQTHPLTQDKFCAGTDAGIGLRQGDSGGGYMEKWNRYYIRGIVSERDGGATNTSVNSFTEISYYWEWLDRIALRLYQSTFIDDSDDDSYDANSST